MIVASTDALRRRPSESHSLPPRWGEKPKDESEIDVWVSSRLEFRLLRIYFIFLEFEIVIGGISV